MEEKIGLSLLIGGIKPPDSSLQTPGAFSLHPAEARGMIGACWPIGRSFHALTLPSRRKTPLSNLLSNINLSIGDIIGSVAAIIFYGRFYLQWYTSERLGRSVVPVGFWYMSCVGSLMLFSYGVYTQSAVGTLSHCFNIVIYVRNLIHVWRKNGTLSRRRSIAVHGLALAVLLVAGVLLVLTWSQVLSKTQSGSATEAERTLFWITVGVVGQGLFACRFLIQWITTERKKESVIPVAFWYFSIAASVLMLASFLQLREWVFAAGIVLTPPIYTRNLWMIHRKKQAFSESA